jgi:nucleotidyltransferase substrate binding protein (TIGR01987 family)
MLNERLMEIYRNYSKAVVRLREVLDADVSNDIVYDAAIQRFEFTYELAWKLMKAYLEFSGRVEVNSPRSAFKEAFAAGLIINGETWIDMIQDRNLTVHTYDEKTAIEIFGRIKDKYICCFNDFSDRMKKEIAE